MGPLKGDPLYAPYLPYTTRGPMLQNPSNEVRDHIKGTVYLPLGLRTQQRPMIEVSGAVVNSGASRNEPFPSCHGIRTPTFWCRGACNPKSVSPPPPPPSQSPSKHSPELFEYRIFWNCWGRLWGFLLPGLHLPHLHGEKPGRVACLGATL